MTLKHGPVNSLQARYLIVDWASLLAWCEKFACAKASVDGGETSNFGSKNYFLALVGSCWAKLRSKWRWLHQILALVPPKHLLLGMLLQTTHFERREHVSSTPQQVIFLNFSSYNRVHRKVNLKRKVLANSKHSVASVTVAFPNRMMWNIPHHFIPQWNDVGYSTSHQ